MPNLHGQPDTLLEISAREGDLLPQTPVSTTWPTVPGSSLTFAPFATRGYAKLATGALAYVDQPAVSLTLPSATGTYWLALHADTYSAVSGWTRRDGSHYLFQLNAAPPLVDPPGGLIFASATVAGGVITTATPHPSRATLPTAWRTFLELGSLATQQANAVAITGGTATLSSATLTTLGVGAGPEAGQAVRVLGATHLQGACVVDTTLGVAGQVAVGVAPLSPAKLSIVFPAATHGLLLQATVAGTVAPVGFRNAGATDVGSITTTDTATQYNTTSDQRLKNSVQALTGALDAVRALRPVKYKWNSTNESDIGFLAHELMVVAPTAVQGLPDEVHPDGTIKPQQVDHSKLVPILVAAVKDLLAQVEALTARMTTLEEQLGL